MTGWEERLRNAPSDEQNLNHSVVHIDVASYEALSHMPVTPSTSNNVFFPVHFRAVQSLIATLCLCGCRSKHSCVPYSAIAAAVVQSQLHEPCSVYYFALFYARQIIFMCSFVPPLLALPPSLK